jgi:hypothetical protein
MKNLEIPRDVAIALIDTVERLEIELEAYRAVLAIFKLTHADDVEALDDTLIASRQSPFLLEAMKEKYDAIRESLYAEEFDVAAQKMIDQLIERLRPTDLLN